MLAKSYPLLFPFGVGDVTNCRYRTRDVSYNEAIKHYLEFFDVNRGKYHFTADHRFIFYLQDRDERLRIQSQAGVYVKQNVADANMSVRDMQSLVSDPSRGVEFYSMVKKMERFVANINGSSSYMYARKRGCFK